MDNKNNKGENYSDDGNSNENQENSNQHGDNNQHSNKILKVIKNVYPNPYDVSQSQGGMENLLMSLGQKPFNSEDYEAQGIFQAIKQDNYQE